MRHTSRARARGSVAARFALGALLASLMFVALPTLAIAYPTTSLGGYSTGWSSTDVVITMWTDFAWDPAAFVFYAFSDTAPPYMTLGEPEGEGWEPGMGWHRYDLPLEISQEGTTTLWYWAYRFC